MEKCPNCGHWTLTFNPTKRIVFCHHCNYEEKVNIEKYRETNDLMPKLSKSLELNGYK